MLKSDIYYIQARVTGCMGVAASVFAMKSTIALGFAIAGIIACLEFLRIARRHELQERRDACVHDFQTNGTKAYGPATDSNGLWIKYDLYQCTHCNKFKYEESHG